MVLKCIYLKLHVQLLIYCEDCFNIVIQYVTPLTFSYNTLTLLKCPYFYFFFFIYLFLTDTFRSFMPAQPLLYGYICFIFHENLTAKRETPVPVLLYIKLIKPMSSIRPLQRVLRLALTPRWCWGDPWRNRDSRHLYLLWNYEPITQYLLYVGNPRQRLVFLLLYRLLAFWKSNLKVIAFKK